MRGSQSPQNSTPPRCNILASHYETTARTRARARPPRFALSVTHTHPEYNIKTRAPCHRYQSVGQTVLGAWFARPPLPPTRLPPRVPPARATNRVRHPCLHPWDPSRHSRQPLRVMPTSSQYPRHWVPRVLVPRHWVPRVRAPRHWVPRVRVPRHWVPRHHLVPSPCRRVPHEPRRTWCSRNMQCTM